MLEKHARSRTAEKDVRATLNLKDLILLLIGHVMRYPMMIGQIIKHAELANRKNVVSAARKGIFNTVCCFIADLTLAPVPHNMVFGLFFM